MTSKPEVWIGMLNVVPRAECEMLAPEKGAFVNVLTWASSVAEYRQKVVRAMNDYGFDVLEIADVELFTERLARVGASDEMFEIADEISSSDHVRYCTFHTYPRVM